MAARKSESLIPTGLQGEDLGQAVTALDGKCTLISFVTAPLVVGRDNTYVLLVTDKFLIGASQSFEWTFKENGNITRVQVTEYGESLYRPSILGTVSVGVRILDAGGIEHTVLSLDQEVVLPSAEIESIITKEQNKPGPGAADPEVLRELVNEHCRYYQQAKLLTPETGDGFRQFLFSMLADGAGRRTPVERGRHAAELATAVNEQPEDFARLAARGVGVSSIRLALLAMVLPANPGTPTPLLPWKELPETGPQHAFEDEQLRKSLATLSEDARVDLFNVARFPKSNIAACGRILEALRDRYFGGTTFDDVLTGMSGTRAQRITQHYREGPLLRS